MGIHGPLRRAGDGARLDGPPAAAAPFAYVTNNNDSTVSVIRTATNKVVATVTVGAFPQAVAITSDGTHAYVANLFGDTVSVIDTASNTVAATVSLAPTGSGPEGVAITPDGKRAYVANQATNNVSVNDTATNKVVTTVPIFPIDTVPFWVAITPDGKRAYVANIIGSNVSVIDTASNTVVATVPVGVFPIAIGITPDGKRAYVSNQGSAAVSVINIASNTVVATVPVHNAAQGIAVTPDGKNVFTTDTVSSVSVIDIISNTVVATVPVGSNPFGVRIVPPPPGIPFLAFTITALDIDFDGAPTFNLKSNLTLSSTAPGLHLHGKPVKLQVGTFSITIPPDSFAKQPDGSFFFAGVIDDVSLKARITPTNTLQYAFHAKATGASLTRTENPVYVTLIIGRNSGATSVTATISP